MQTVRLLRRAEVGWWGWLDWASHHLPLPARVQGWICDRFDRSLLDGGYLDPDWDKAKLKGPVRRRDNR